MPEVQPAHGMRKRFLTTVFVMAAVLARMLARIWSDPQVRSEVFRHGLAVGPDGPSNPTRGELRETPEPHRERVAEPSRPRH